MRWKASPDSQAADVKPKIFAAVWRVDMVFEDRRFEDISICCLAPRRKEGIRRKSRGVSYG